MYASSLSSTRRSRVRIKQLAASCATPLARVHPMAMTSSRSAHTSSLQPAPPASVDGARKPIFHASCSAYENWWKNI
eukprot:3529435-Pleurochrysis_carterae.AAC.1